MTKHELYPIAFEIAGDFGMFADPADGLPVAKSYPLPPKTACYGMINSIIGGDDEKTGLQIEPIAVATCNFPTYEVWATNSKTHLRKGSSIKFDSPLQMCLGILSKPRFQILALVRSKIGGRAHSFQSQFFRRIAKGQSRYPVSLGHKEFMAIELTIPTTPVEINYSHVIPSFLDALIYRTDVPPEKRGKFKNNVPIVQGMLKYSDVDVCLKDDLLTFSNPEFQQQLEYIYGRIKTGVRVQ